MQPILCVCVSAIFIQEVYTFVSSYQPISSSDLKTNLIWSSPSQSANIAYGLEPVFLHSNGDVKHIYHSLGVMWSASSSSSSSPSPPPTIQVYTIEQRTWRKRKHKETKQVKKMVSKRIQRESKVVQWHIGR